MLLLSYPNQVYTLFRIFKKNRILLKLSQILGKCICYKEPEEALEFSDISKVLEGRDPHPQIEEEDKEFNVAKLMDRKNELRSAIREVILLVQETI